ncbi:hypothetical protein GCM10008015_26820 [Flavobacterium palustre]|uniref:Phage tail tube protein n=1 Tax=Flavobacterium palustre TaxID=1476463 RepID=A0ABQ1HQI8_9FLAO|nr:hypothetical protein [Flavobacterium palustre]GGA84672.1 hypothetical protein GCM10008015_26820 [Flavobacterium palustre]
MATPTIINKFGTMQGWTSIVVNMLGRDLEGILELKYTDEVKKENVKGGGMFPIGRSRGDYEATASIKLYKEEVDALMLSLAPGKRLQDIAPFDIVAEYQTEAGAILKDRIRNCEFTNAGVEVAQGDGTISTDFKLIISHIEYNVI